MKILLRIKRLRKAFGAASPFSGAAVPKIGATIPLSGAAVPRSRALSPRHAPEQRRTSAREADRLTKRKYQGRFSKKRSDFDGLSAR